MDARSKPPRFSVQSSRLFLAAVGAGVANVLLQVAYPLVHGEGRRLLTIWSVVAFFLFSSLHALSTHTVRGLLALIGVCVGGGFVAEAIGSRTGIPFGNYDYTSTLGLRVLGVPVAVPLAWAMMGWPSLLAARRLFGSGVRVALFGALILTAWDLMLDPQMVDAGHWIWRSTPGPWLNGIPMVNSLGWFVIATAMIAGLDRVVPPSVFAGSKWFVLPVWAMLAWTWFSETLGHIAFFGSPRVGLIGGVVLGAVLLPWFRVAIQDARSVRSVQTAQTAGTVSQ
jgi:uncharacterized membrane protein